MTAVNKTKVTQIGIMVKDLEKSVAAYEEFLGVKADYVGVTEKYEVTKAEYKGKPCYGRCYQALFNLDNVQIELVSPYGDEPSVWRDCLEKDGEGLHHLAFLTDNIQDTMNKMQAEGVEVMQYGTWPDEPKPGQYAYMDTRPEIKAIVEMLEV
jgi:methylmalonyl-CoA/ethylmalonyl-CoA epimerase